MKRHKDPMKHRNWYINWTQELSLGHQSIFTPASLYVCNVLNKIVDEQIWDGMGWEQKQVTDKLQTDKRKGKLTRQQSQLT